LIPKTFPGSVTSMYLAEQNPEAAEPLVAEAVAFGTDLAGGRSR
jgi:hypothetical protein